MARLLKLNGSLRFRDSETDPEVENSDEVKKPMESIGKRDTEGLSPFQRAKMRTCDCFLSSEIMPTAKGAN